MSQLVLYRKYRPQLFAEVINQKTIINALSSALLQGQVSHAYLFAGLRGVGKTTVARLLAKALNCQGRKSNQFEPCNKCESCLAIKAGNSLDLIEIDAASNRGIEDVRSLRENIKFPPVNSKYKIFIIDEAHQMTREAFNALLKTLEEPPSYAIFILATTEPDKLPATILSRVERYDFKKLNLDDMIRCLKNICKQEKIKFEDEALRLISLYSEGGLRDAQSLLGQISLVTDKNITKKAVEELVGAINFEKVKKFIICLAKKDKEKALEFINNLYDEGYDLEVFNKETLNYLRKILLLKISPILGKVLEKETTNEEMTILFKQAESFDTPYLEKLLKRFIEIQVQLRRTPIPTLPFELCISEEL
jgi:DNA polymerase III subunit gamma/tau